MVVWNLGLVQRSPAQGTARVTPELLGRFDGLPRHAWRAARLTFPHPRTRAPVTVESPLPADLALYLEGLRD